MSRPLISISVLLALAGCAGAPEERVDPAGSLRLLEAMQLAPPPPASVARVATDGGPLEPRFDATDGLDAREASAVALHLHPRLRALRAEIGVARAQLVEAGLLPDPTIGWESGNVVADFITDRKSTANSYIAGAVVEWPVPRPGEIGAREAEAAGRVDESRAALLEAEWRLVGEVHAACARLAAAEAGLRLADEQLAVAERTRATFGEARQLGEATALQARLAGVARARVAAERARLAVEVTEARQAVLALLGLPPGAPFTLQGGARLLAAVQVDDPARLVAAAVLRRPDLAALAARHRQADARLRLEEARRWPQVTIGSGVSITLPFFSRFNGPAVRTALRARDVARRAFDAGIHEARREVFAAWAAHSAADAYVRTLEEEVLPAVDESLRLTRAAVQAGEFTAFDVLTAQTQALEAQTQLLAARARRAEARVALDVASGRLVPAPAPAPSDDDDAEEE